MNHEKGTRIYHFQGLKWFGFPLKYKDEIEITEIKWKRGSSHLKLTGFFSDKEEYINREEVCAKMTDFSSMPYDDDGESDPFPKEQEDREETQPANKRCCHFEDGGGPSLSQS